MDVHIYILHESERTQNTICFSAVIRRPVASVFLLTPSYQ